MRAGPPSSTRASLLDAFKHRAFTIIWIVTVVANVGTWVQSTAAGWLMTTLDSRPMMVAMVQAATAMPLFLLGLPAGALADIFDRRHLLLLMETVGVLLTFVLAWMVSANEITAMSLLLLIFLAGVAFALDAPAWQAIVPQLIRGDKDLGSAVALNSIGVNISRAIGPAFAGVCISIWGMASPYWINAWCTLGVIVALYWWRPAPNPNKFPRERIGNAILVGLRHARHNEHLRAALVRSAGFFLFAAAYWALLPLVASDQIKGGPGLYGLLLAAIGVGGLGGAFVLPRLKVRLSADARITLGSVGTSIALLLFASAHEITVALFASVLAGACWIGIIATLNVSAQIALPSWVRGRGLATYATVMFGAMTLGSVIWGLIASVTTLSIANIVAAIALIGLIPFIRKWKLETGPVDLTPSMHWPEPVLAGAIDDDRGPVLVTVEYHILPSDRDAFLTAIRRASSERKRDGAYQWDLFEDVEKPGRWLEVFLVDSWLEHKRQHARVTKVDQLREHSVYQFQIDGRPPIVRHLLSADASHTASKH